MAKNDRKLSNGFERLEQKALMCGDVAVSLSGDGDLLINEAHYDVNDCQEIRVFELSDGRVRVQGLNGTQVGFNNDIRNFHNFWVNDGIRVNLGHGADKLTMESWNGGVDADEVVINMGGGSDDVTIRGLDATDDVHINTGSGNDDVHVSRSRVRGTGNDLRLNTGSGADTVVLRDVDVRDDIVVQTYASSTSNEVDDVEIRSSDFDDVYAYLGAGNDDLLLDNNDFDRAHLYLGSGHDDADFWSNEADSISTRGGAGNDDVSALANDVRHFSFNGEGGFDEYFQHQNRHGKNSNNFDKIETPSATTRFV